MNEGILTGRATIARLLGREPWKTNQWFAKDFIQTESGATVPLIYGTAKLTGNAITPIWGMRASQIDGGKKGGSQYKYNGSLALGIQLGPVDILHEIRNGDTVIFKGPLFRSSANGSGYTAITTTIGLIRFYWGTSSQTADPSLTTLVINTTTNPTPTYSNVCYCVAFDLAFGQQTTPPDLTFVTSRFPSSLTYDPGLSRISVTNVGHNYQSVPTVTITGGGGTGATAVATVLDGELISVAMTNVGSGYTSAPTISFTGGSPDRAATAVATLFHEQAGDAELAEIIYDLMTNTFYGASIATGEIDVASFNDCAATLFSEGIACSVVLDQAQTLRDTLGTIYGIGLVYPVYQNGKLYLRKVRSTDTPGTTLTEADLLEEPTAQNDGIDKTWNWTRVSFTNVDNDWQTDVAAYFDSANENIVGRRVPNDVSLPWITNPDVAQSVANRIGATAGIPVITWTLKVKPKWKTILPGDLVPFSYGALGISAKPLRIHSVRVGSAEEPAVTLTGIEEATRDQSFDFLAQSASAPYHNVNANGTRGFNPLDSVPYLAWVPPNLLNGDPDGIMCCLPRPNAQHTSAEAFWTWDELQLTYQSIGSIKQYPVAGSVVWWQRIRENNWLLRITIQSQDDLEYLTSIQNSRPDVYIVMGQRNTKTYGVAKASYLMTPLMGKIATSGIFQAVSANQYDIEITGGAYGTPDLQLEGTADLQIGPATQCFIGRLTDFIVYTSSAIRFQRQAPNSQTDRRDGTTPDTSLQRYVKALTHTPTDVQLLGEVTASVFARNNITGGSTGTVTPDWGIAALTSYEAFDIAAASAIAGQTSAYYGSVQDIDRYLADLLNQGASSLSSDEYARVEHIDKVLGFMISAPVPFYNEAGDAVTAGAIPTTPGGSGDTGGTSGSVTPTPILTVTFVARTIGGAAIRGYVQVTNADALAQFTYIVASTNPGAPTPGTGGWSDLAYMPKTISFTTQTLWVYCQDTGKTTSALASLDWADVSGL